jgi:hypothetical protein
MLLSMIEAAKEEILSSFPMWYADPASAACTFNLEKPHQGSRPKILHCIRASRGLTPQVR